MAVNRVISMVSMDFLKGSKYLKKNRLPIIPLSDEQTTEEFKFNKKYIEFKYVSYRDNTNSPQKKFYDADNYLKLYEYNNFLCLEVDKTVSSILQTNIEEDNYLYVVFTGVMSKYKVHFISSKKNSTGEDEVCKKVMLQRAKTYLNETLAEVGFEKYGIPPEEAVAIPEGGEGTHDLEDDFWGVLLLHDPEVTSRAMFRFLSGENTLAHFAEHSLGVETKKLLLYFENMDILHEKLLHSLTNADAIHSIQKNMKANNKFWHNKAITFIDGGVTSMPHIPHFNYHLVRVGEYTVKPGSSSDGGKTPSDDREFFAQKNYVASEIFTDKSIIIKDKYSPSSETDMYKRNECARYIFEAHYAWMRSRGKMYDEYNEKWIDDIQPEVIFFHGPIQNSFVMYTQDKPNHIPGIDKQWLEENDITEAKIKKCLGSRFTDKMEWNSPLVVYIFLMHQLSKSKVPILGCVERSSSSMCTQITVRNFINSKMDRDDILSQIDQYDLTDDKLFGFILKEAQFTEPVNWVNEYDNNIKNNSFKLPEISKQIYGSIVDSMPLTKGCMMNCEYTKLPFRVEVINNEEKYSNQELMELVYNTSITCGEYLFPVGLDIVDKHVKIPNSVNKLATRQYALKAYGEALKHDINESKSSGEFTGRYLHHSMKVLAGHNGRDFFYRPNESRLTNKKRSKK